MIRIYSVIFQRMTCRRYLCKQRDVISSEELSENVMALPGGTFRTEPDLGVKHFFMFKSKRSGFCNDKTTLGLGMKYAQ